MFVKRLLIISLSLMFLLFLIFFNSGQSKASIADHLVINEVYYDAATDYPEWIELYNPTEDDLDIAGWLLTDEENSFIFDPGTEIASKEYLVITKSLSDFQAKYNTIADFEWGNLALSNSGDEVMLKDQSDIIVDAVIFEKVGIPEAQPHPGVAKGYSIERQPKGEDSDNCQLDFVDQPNPSPYLGLPSNIKLELIDKGETFVEISWNENEDEDFEYYEVLSSSDKINWEIIETITERSETNFLIEDLISGETIYLKTCTTNFEGGFWCSNILSVTTDIVYSNQIIINELFPRPSQGSEKEFIELYNGSNQDVEIGNWFLDDIEGGSSPYTIPNGTKVGAKSYLVIYQSESGIALNDSGDRARLFWPTGELCSKSSQYSSADKDISWSKDENNDWQFSTTATPGAKNIISKPVGGGEDSPVITDIAGAKRQPKNTWVRVEGIVTATPGLFGSRVLYIQDGGGGIKIYFSQALWPALKIGDILTVFGKISTTSGEFIIRLYDSSAVVVIGHTRAPPPQKKKINELEGQEGLLVTVSGRVVKSAGSTFYIADSSGEIRIYYYKYTGIKKLGLKKGDWITVTGILSRTSSGLRILPRGMFDLLITRTQEQRNKETQKQITDSGKQILGVEKAHASQDYREATEEEESNTLVTLGWTLLLVGVILFGSLIITSQRHAKDNKVE